MPSRVGPGRAVASPASGSADWAERVANALDDLVIYERQHENALRGLLAQGRRALGLPQAPHSHTVGDRVSRYVRLYTSGADGSSEYETNLVPRLTTVVDVLLEHPVFTRATRDAEGQLVVGIDLAFEWIVGRPVARILEGL